jgi:hypothetical protein
VANSTEILEDLLSFTSFSSNLLLGGHVLLEIKLIIKYMVVVDS